MTTTSNIVDTSELPGDTQLPGHQYTLGEMREIIRKMRAVNQAFYSMATQTGCHAFIEFCGMQSKFIDMCACALKQGVEFPFANTHSKMPLPFADHDAQYLGEKFNCVFGHVLARDPAVRAAFECKAYAL